MSEHTNIVPGSVNTISTVEKSGKRKWQYAHQPKGRLYNLRTIISIVYLILFFTLPFIKYKGTPLFLFDFPNATFILFGKIFVPTDFLVLGVGMLVGLLFIIVFTLVYGRVFCGWACPQTIFLEMVFRRIEYWIEGSAKKQYTNDHKKWTTGLYIRKAIKHIIYFIISFIVANTFLAYIIGVDELFKIIGEPFTEHLGGFLSIIFFTLAFYAVFAFVREIVCIVICPYGRLQSVLLDRNSIVVAYNYLRGEPRTKKRKDEPNAGDCIDCNMCVNVCPTGIDIRNGTQLECVNCTACIDACNMMMDAVDRPPDLITFASENNIASGQKTRITTRIKGYSAVLLALLGLLTYLLATRDLFEAKLLRVPGQVLQENADGTISNLYRIKITSKSRQTEPYHLEMEGSAAKIEYVGKHVDSLQPGFNTEETFFLKVPADQIKKRKEVYKVKVMRGNDIIDRKDLIFIGEH